MRRGVSLWGILQGILLVINHITTKPRRRLLKRLNIQKDNKFLAIFDYLSTFILIMLSWVFFRSETIGNALLYISRIFSKSILSLPEISARSMLLIIIILFFLLFEWIGRAQQFAIENFGIGITKTIRWVIYIVIIMFIIQYSGTEQKFIYFQF
ncbi:MAG: hypothetical protein NTY74_11250 [Ignavibacteriae bacterium]|nr:hypothetical protein [Ignavibacteriota bacterium]